MRKNLLLSGLLALLIPGVTQATGQNPPPPKLGVFLAFANNQAIVTSTVPGSIADLVGIKAGDEILELNDEPINVQADADAFEMDGSALRHILFLRKSDGKKVTVAMGANPYAYDPNAMTYSIAAGSISITVH